MAEPLTAAQLIALLREHPLTCGTIGVSTGTLDEHSYATQGLVGIDTQTDSCTHLRQTERFRRWLTGALVEAHDERDIDLPVRCMSNGVPYYAINDGNEISHPTILHALLAGLEANIKETT